MNEINKDNAPLSYVHDVHFQSFSLIFYLKASYVRNELTYAIVII